MTHIRDEIHYWLALIHGGNAIAHYALKEYLAKGITIDSLFQKPLGIANPKLKAYLKAPHWDLIERDLKWLNRTKKAHIITWQDPHYPPLLKEIANPPLLLYVLGNQALLTTPQIAIVGSRNPTPAGYETAYHFSYDLTATGLTITSGLALGIDIASHRGALANRGKTIAVMGCGLDRIYPPQHSEIAEQIKEQGALISIFPPGAAPKPQHFPIRNRIISGLCLGTLVVEAAYQSGSLITAHYAAEQGREVFAIPGSIHNPLSKGCHHLLRQGACLVENVQDILEALPNKALFSTAHLIAKYPEDQIKASLLCPANQLLSYFDYEITAVDSLIARSGLTAEQVCSMLSYLELQGLVASVPGGYIKKAKR